MPLGQLVRRCIIAQVSFEISTAFLGRMRARIIAEQPALAGQTNAVINEAARVRVRQMICDWVRSGEAYDAAKAAQNAVTPPNGGDIT